ncbi:cytochrome P450 [Rostrohypoxylon terebratum]|nr:cytochrome P450 [Rostrohypoxylon terebratum]
MLLANVWHFTQDPYVYEDPITFNPERFLEPEGHKLEPDPYMFAFGFGRRICPGRYLADNALYLNTVQTLATFKISKYLENGQDKTFQLPSVWRRVRLVILCRTRTLLNRGLPTTSCCLGPSRKHPRGRRAMARFCLV